jgi:transcriptional regulator with XRE-family HTH domain
MRINSNRLRELRAARQWSQEQLAQLSGLNLRTIQRLESGAKISTESLRALAAVFEVPAESLLAGEPAPSQPALHAIREGVLRGLEFSGVTARAEFWWFALAVVMVLALARLLAEAFGALPLQIASLVVLLPWIAACTRRLRDAGFSPWWQLISLVPVAGILVLLYLLAFPARRVSSGLATAGEEPA